MKIINGLGENEGLHTNFIFLTLLYTFLMTVVFTELLFIQIFQVIYNLKLNSTQIIILLGCWSAFMYLSIREGSYNNRLYEKLKKTS